MDHISASLQSIQPQKALDIYEKMLNRNGDSWMFFSHCAQLMRRLGGLDEAAEKIQTNVELAPNNKIFKETTCRTFKKGGKIRSGALDP